MLNLSAFKQHSENRPLDFFVNWDTVIPPFLISLILNLNGKQVPHQGSHQKPKEHIDPDIV